MSLNPCIYFYLTFNCLLDSELFGCTHLQFTSFVNVLFYYNHDFDLNLKTDICIYTQCR